MSTIVEAFRKQSGAPTPVIAPTLPGDHDHLQLHLRRHLQNLPMPPRRRPMLLMAGCDGVAKTVVQRLLGEEVQTPGFEFIRHPISSHPAIGAGVVTADGDAVIRYVWPPQLVEIRPAIGFHRVALTDWLTMIERPGAIELRTLDAVRAVEVTYTDLDFSEIGVGDLDFSEIGVGDLDFPRSV